MSDTYSYGTADPNYFAKQYPGVFDPVPREQNGERWQREHPELAKYLPRAKSMADPNPPRRKRKVQAVPSALKPPERAGDVIVIRLPLPHKQLHKNGGQSKKYGWRQSLIRAAHNAAHMAAWLVRPTEQWGAVRIDMTFWLARRHDDDGLVHWIYPYRDGIARAIGVNDSRFTIGSVVQHTGKNSNGRREVELVVTKL